MTWQAWAAVIGVLLSFAAMAAGRASAELSFGVVLSVLVLLGVVSPSQALVGFSNEQVHTIALLFVVAATLERAGSLELATSRVFVHTRSVTRALFQLTLPVLVLSAVLNNTPVVAMLIPQVRAWAQRTGISASRLLIPLSYAAILGGLITVIGTSTNLVVNGLVADAGKQTIGFLEIGKIGAPVALLGVLLLVPLARWVLPERQDLDTAFADPRTFVTEALVDESSPYVGRPLSEVRVSDAPAMLPVEIIRERQVIPAPRSDQILCSGDRLVFTGPAAYMLSLKRNPSLSVAESGQFEATMDKRVLIELVLSARCPLIGGAIGGGGFRRRYNAAVVAVARQGGRVTSLRLDEWLLRVGDVVLVECGPDFLSQHKNSPDFYVVTPRGESTRAPSQDAWVGLLILAVMVGAAAVGWVSMLEAALLGTAALVCARLLEKSAVKDALDLRLLLAIALALGLGRTLETTGAAAQLASALTALGGTDPWVSLVMLYLGTTILTEVITNNAAAAIAVPLALATAENLGVSHLPFTVGVMIAASASFVTPMGYQTNMMVYGPGNYRFADFMKAGLVMNLFVAVVSLMLIPRIWPF